MKLKSIGIANFKAFGANLQTVPIRPITLVFGPNSAGKSSLLHSVLWLNHIFRTGDCEVTTPQASLGQVDLGGFSQVQHRHQKGGVQINLQFSCDPALGDTEDGEPIASLVEIELTYGPTYGLRLKLGRDDESAYGLIGSRLILDRRTFLKTSGANVTELDLDHPCLLESIGEFSKNAKVDVEKIHRFLAQEISQGINFRIINGLPASLDYWWIEAFMPMNKLRAPFRREALRFLKEVVSQKTDQVLKLLREATQKSIVKLTYLPPVRELPPRGFDPSKRPEAAWKEIARNPDLVKRLNEWLGNDRMLGTGYTLVNRAFLPTESIHKRSPALIRRELWDLLKNTNFAADAAYHVENAEAEFEYLDKLSYVNDHPDLHDEIVEYERDFAASNDDFWDPPYSVLSPKERERRAERSAEICIHDGSANTQIWDYYLGNYQPLTKFLNEKWNIDNASKRLASGIENECPDRKYELSLVQSGNGTRLALQDVGYGISQFLPVLIHSFASKNQLIAIEQPEIHIHPRLQAELGDVFIESALGENKNTFLLETHSEHLILRILRRIRETTEGEMADWPEALRKACPDGIRPEDVAVLYVEPGEDGAKVIELPMTPDGDFSRPWPSGFFTDRAKELY